MAVASNKRMLDRWVTIGEGDEGGSPVMIDEDGEITKGPAGMVGDDANHPTPESQSEAPADSEPQGSYEDRQSDWETGLSPESRDAINQYSDEAYKDVRDFQLGKIDPSDPRHEKAKEISDRLESALNAAPGKEATVYRGLSNLSESQYQAMLGGGEITLDTVTSTSENRRVSEDFVQKDRPGARSLMFQIQQKSGVSLANLSKYPTEKELLVKKGARFKVTGSEMITTKTGAKVQMLKMSEVS